MHIYSAYKIKVDLQHLKYLYCLKNNYQLYLNKPFHTKNFRLEINMKIKSNTATKC